MENFKRIMLGIMDFYLHKLCKIQNNLYGGIKTTGFLNIYRTDKATDNFIRNVEGL